MDCISCGTKFDATQGACPQCGWDPGAVRDATAGYRPGEMVRSRYEVLGPLGTGRLGTVLKATDADSGQPVAVKVIHPALIPDVEVGRQFLLGMRPLIRMSHPSFNRLIDVNCEGDRYFVVHELLDGVPLRDLMDSRRDQGRGFALDEVFPIIRQVTSFLMESEIGVHGSISPENIWILPECLFVLDAGLALQLPGGAVGHCLSRGRKPGGYVAPEVARGATPDARADVFSLAVVLGEMLTQISFDGRPEVFAHSDPDLPEDVDTILRRALLGDPRGRHADTAELLETIAAAISIPAPVFERPTPVDDLAGPPPDEAPPPPKAAPPAGKSAKDFGLENLPESTVQVSMEDVIRAHAEATAGAAKETSPVPLARPISPPPAQRPSTPPPAQRPSTPPPAARQVRPSTPPPVRRAAAPPAARRPSTPPPASRRPSTPPPAARRPSTPPPAARRPSTPPPARRVSAPPPARVSSTPAPPMAQAVAEPDRQPPMVKAPPLNAGPNIEPRRPAPLSRDTIPPAPLASPATPGQRPTYPPPHREVTQEIDLDAIESVEEAAPRREVTQEVALDQIVSVDRSSMGDAVSKLEEQAKAAEAQSADELLKRADKLEGVDPRFVRAAHKLESERHGARSRKAAEMLKERASELDGIDPRLLRAAARLEEAKVSDVVQPEEKPEPKRVEEEPDSAAQEDDWRAKLAESSEDSVISFIAPPVVQRSREVSGFPRTQQRSQRSRPPTEPPRAAPPPSPARRDEKKKR